MRSLQSQSSRSRYSAPRPHQHRVHFCENRFCGRKLHLRKCRSEEDREDISSVGSNQLGATIKRKQREIKRHIEELGTDTLAEKLQDAANSVPRNPFRLGQLIQQHGLQGRTTLVAEVPRLSLTEPVSALAARAALMERAGADVLVVNTDEYDTPTGLQDLFAVVSAVKCPVMRRDWFIHPIQVLETRQSGAAGVLGIVCQVSAKGTPVMSSFAAALGLDAPIEIVNKAELDFLIEHEVPMFAVSCSVKLALPIPGFAADITKALLGSLPAGVPALVGVKSLEEAQSAAMNGAACLLLRGEWVSGLFDGDSGDVALTDVSQFFADVRYAASLDA